ncbi:hypothetical protein IQ07DRAFT_584336 [Pyrenochaeta sp. DS3sAY3a]|nr:hypothetical protein IQ07DRAFT_584336 [Pyrenochaeta sp. DS3sAY3a]
MSSTPTPPFHLKLPIRNSLATIGIPDEYDTLAISFHWRRQAYYRTHDHEHAGPILASSSRASSPPPASGAADEGSQPITPSASVQCDSMFEQASLAAEQVASALGQIPTPPAGDMHVDLLGMGARFDGEAAADEYAAEIEILA